MIMIGEHGDYPWNEKGQHLFPRKYFMEQILGVFASSGRSVPVFVRSAARKIHAIRLDQPLGKYMQSD